jgi:hypothetical protein
MAMHRNTEGMCCLQHLETGGSPLGGRPRHFYASRHLGERVRELAAREGLRDGSARGC